MFGIQQKVKNMSKLNLEVSYQYPFNDWSVFNVFNGFYNELIKKHKSINFNYIDSGKFYDGNPCSYYSPHIMCIKNKKNDKYITISYWDRAEELSYETHGWDDEKRVQLVTSSGVHSDINYTPFSYICYSKLFDIYHKNSLVMSKKPNNELFFKGFLYGERFTLSETNKINITNQKTSPDDKYFEELTNNRILLSLNGAGEICNRDLEILSSRSVLFRPKLTQKFHNELIPDYHYITFDHSSDPNEQADIILKKFNEVKNDVKFLKFISENGYKWFKQNGTIDSNVKILKKVVNLNLLK